MKNKEDGASFTKKIKAKRAAKKAAKAGEGKKRGLFDGVKKAVKSAASKAGAKVKDAAKSATQEETVANASDGMSMHGASATAGQKRRSLKRAKKRKYGKGQSGKNKEAAQAGREFAAGQMDMMADIAGPSMYGKKNGASMPGMISMYKKFGPSMNAYQDKEASMDDYSHEKKLKSDGRYEAAHGKMANAKNDFDHAHALKKDAKHDAKGRHSIMKHMRGFK